MQNLADKKEHYTVKDYMSWGDDVICQLIDGKIYDMVPAPKTKHQSISISISSRIYIHLIGKECQIFDAPADVILSDDTVVQPDIFIVCDKTKITENNIKGAPDVIFEILSQSTAYTDRKIKLKLYERFEVKEYFLVNPIEELVEIYRLEKEKYINRIVANWNETIKIKTIGLELNLWEIFEKEKPED